MLAFDARGPLRVDAAQQLGGPLRPKPAGRAAGDELSQRHMQPTGGRGAQRHPIVVAVDHHPGHRGVVLHPHRPQSAGPQPGDGRGQRVVGVVLARRGRAPQPDPRGQRRRHVDDLLTRLDERLGQQFAQPLSRFDRPGPLRAQRLRPRQPPRHLTPVSHQSHPRERPLVPVDRHRRVGRLVRVDTNDHRHRSPPRARVWASRRALRMQVLRASFEPHRDRTLAGWRFVRKPTRHASSRQFESQPTKTPGRYEHTLNARPDPTIRQLWR
jgi:hypothetical protein